MTPPPNLDAAGILGSFVAGIYQDAPRNDGLSLSWTVLPHLVGASPDKGVEARRAVALAIASTRLASRALAHCGARQHAEDIAAALVSEPYYGITNVPYRAGKAVERIRLVRRQCKALERLIESVFWATTNYESFGVLQWGRSPSSVAGRAGNAFAAWSRIVGDEAWTDAVQAMAQAVST